jgi:predicted nucleic acid-binding protein
MDGTEKRKDDSLSHLTIPLLRYSQSYQLLIYPPYVIIILRQDSEMKKLRIYLETSVLNFYFAEDVPSDREATHTLFEEIKAGNYEAYTSLAVLEEISRAPEKEKKQMLNLIKLFNLTILEVELEAQVLADIYVREGIIPEKYRNDALHIAISTVSDMDLLLSWNFKHIVKRKTRLMANVINAREGFRNLDICTPLEVIESED